jgi:putative FmdB family regulatory protein
MPTYEYECTECGRRFDVVQSFSDAPLTDCEECGGRLRKVFSAVGVVFKGSGFYKTDSRTAGDKKESGAKKEPAATDSPKSPDAGASSSTAPEKATSAATSATTSSGASD